MEIQSVIKQFEYYKGLGEKTIEVLSDEELHLEPAVNANSISIIVKHMWGNMLSRWTNFLSEDGEKEWRKRDEEFEVTIKTREELIEKWNEGWKCLFDALNSLKPEDLAKTIYIRNKGQSAEEAIHRQLAHYSYHIGQIVYLGKIIKGEDWESLSIPIGGSKAFNDERFSQEKEMKHYTDDLK